MKDKDKYIDDFFEQNLSGFKMGAASQGWKGVSAGLSKKVLWSILKSTTWLKSVAGIVVSSGVILTSMVSSNETPEFRLEIAQQQQQRVEDTRCDNTINSLNTISYAEVETNYSNNTASTSSENSKISTAFTNNRISENTSNSKSEFETNTLKEQQQYKTINTNADNLDRQIKKEEAKTGIFTTIKNEGKADPFKLEQTLFADESSQSLAEQESTNRIKAEQVFKTETNIIEKQELQIDELITPNISGDLESSMHALTIERAALFPMKKLTLKLDAGQPDSEQFSEIKTKSAYTEDKGLTWALAAFGGFGTSMPALSTSNTENESLLSFLIQGNKENLLYSSGIRLEARGKKMLWETGIHYHELQQQSQFNLAGVFKQSSTWEYEESSYAIVDTGSYYTQVGNEIIWHYTYDTLEVVHLLDSTETISNDTIHNQQQLSRTNTIKYIEVPLIVGYTFNHGRWTSALKSGVISSFLWKSNYVSVAGQSSGDEYIITRDKFPSVRFDLYAALELRYLIGRRYFLFSEAYYRQSLNPMLTDNHIKRHYTGYGVKLGAGFYF